MKKNHLQWIFRNTSFITKIQADFCLLFLFSKNEFDTTNLSFIVSDISISFSRIEIPFNDFVSMRFIVSLL